MKTAFDIFETNEDLEKNGVWQDFKTFRVLLARSGGSNTEYNKEFYAEAKNQGVASVEALSGEDLAKILKTIFCKTVIKKHQIKNEDGEWEDGCWIREGDEIRTVPFTVENMIKMLDQLPEYFKKLNEWADNYKVFRTSLEEDQEKN